MHSQSNIQNPNFNNYSIGFPVNPTAPAHGMPHSLNIAHPQVPLPCNVVPSSPPTLYPAAQIYHPNSLSHLMTAAYPSTNSSHSLSPTCHPNSRDLINKEIVHLIDKDIAICSLMRAILTQNTPQYLLPQPLAVQPTNCGPRATSFSTSSSMASYLTSPLPVSSPLLEIKHSQAPITSDFSLEKALNEEMMLRILWEEKKKYQYLKAMLAHDASRCFSPQPSVIAQPMNCSSETTLFPAPSIRPAHVAKNLPVSTPAIEVKSSHLAIPSTISSTFPVQQALNNDDAISHKETDEHLSHRNEDRTSKVHRDITHSNEAQIISIGKLKHELTRPRKKDFFDGFIKTSSTKKPSYLLRHRAYWYAEKILAFDLYSELTVKQIVETVHQNVESSAWTQEEDIELIKWIVASTCEMPSTRPSPGINSSIVQPAQRSTPTSSSMQTSSSTKKRKRELPAPVSTLEIAEGTKDLIRNETPNTPNQTMLAINEKKKKGDVLPPEADVSETLSDKTELRSSAPLWNTNQTMIVTSSSHDSHLGFDPNSFFHSNNEQTFSSVSSTSEDSLSSSACSEILSPKIGPLPVLKGHSCDALIDCYSDL